MASNQQQQRQKKRHLCQWPSCGKSFNRSDHLQRHILNHSSEGNTCPRCRAHFKRLDLLDRHLIRHKQKDAEAGGVGLGVVETRKKLWRDADGNVVNKRPRLPNQVPTFERSSRISRQCDAWTDEYKLAMQNRDSGHPACGQVAEELGLTTVGEDDGSNLFNFNTSARCDPGNLGSEPATITPAIDDLPTPDAGEIFYDDFWPFAKAINFSAGTFDILLTPNSSYDWLLDPTLDWVSGNPSCTKDSYSFDLDDAWRSESEIMPIMEPDDFLNRFSQPYFPPVGPDNVHKFDFPDPNVDHSNGTKNSPAGSLPQVLSTGDFDTGPTTASAPLQNLLAYEPSSCSGQQLSISSRSKNRHGFLLQPGTSTRYLPVIDDLSWARVLDIITHAAVRAPDGTIISKAHLLLSLRELQTYCDLFFINFNTDFPLIHRATFASFQTQPLLLLSVILLGATYGNENAKQLAICIHDKVSVQILQDYASLAAAELWLLQAILLFESFGMLRAGHQNQGIVHIYHDLIVNLTKEFNHPNPQGRDECIKGSDPTQRWHAAVEAEQQKRLIAMCFMLDTHRALLFSYPSKMSIFDLQITLPCSPAIWEAESVEEWQYNSPNEPKAPLFLTTVKSFMSRSIFSRAKGLDAFSYILVLHGLMSISTYMDKRSQEADSYTLDQAETRYSNMSMSYDVWKADFDVYCNSFMESIRFVPDTDRYAPQYDFERFRLSTLSLYHFAKMILNVDIINLQIYAGSRRVAGQHVHEQDRERSQRETEVWGLSQDSCSSATRAIWHAAHILRQSVPKMHNTQGQDMLHKEWCLYLASLTCWAFAHIRSRGTTVECCTNTGLSGGEIATVRDLSDSTLWEAKSEMIAVLSAILSREPNEVYDVKDAYPTKGLVTTVLRQLDSLRSDTAEEGMRILARLKS